VPSTDDPAGEKPRRYWRLTLRSAPMLGFALLGQWQEQTRIFRWKWLARTAARRHKRAAARDVLTEAAIEPYVPGANIVTLPPPRPAKKKPEASSKH